MSPVMLGLLLDAFLETLVMVAISSGLAAVVGVPLGVILVATSHGHIRENAAVNRTLGAVVNAARSTPFLICRITRSSCSPSGRATAHRKSKTR